jgi:hypothetical protein
VSAAPPNDTHPKTLVLDEAVTLANLPPEVFRVVRDFGIHLRDTGQSGVHISFASSSEGEIARFPWWDHADADLREMSDDDVPTGTVERPFDDVEQGWRILIWERQGHVFVMEGGGDRRRYRRWFAVPRETYFSAWRDAIEQVRSAGGAFKTLATALRQPGAVRALRLGNQRLAELPPEIGSLENLEHLDLYLNQLSTLPAEIGRLKRLRSLDLRFNKIETLPDTFAMLDSLESVNLAENRLCEIPPWVARMPKLAVFFVHGNPVAPGSMEWIERARPDLEVDYRRTQEPPPG